MAQADIIPGSSNLYIITYTNSEKNTFRSATLASSNGVGKPASAISLDVDPNQINQYTDRVLYNAELSDLKQPTVDYDPFSVIPPNCTIIDNDGDCEN